MPSTGSSRLRQNRPRTQVTGYAGTLTLPARQTARSATRSSGVDALDVGFLVRVRPGPIRANLLACTSLTCLDNVPGTAASDDRLANARPACCQAAVDIDEPVYALSRLCAMGETEPGHAHQHGVCEGAAARWMAVGTAVAAGVGIWYGVRNLTASRQTGTVLQRMRSRAEQRYAERQSGPPVRTQDAAGARSLPLRQALRNDKARIRCLRDAEDTHRFAAWHGGVLQIANGALLLASVAAPALAPVATGGMVVFCGLQAWRFAQTRRATALPASLSTATLGVAAQDGLNVVERRNTERNKAFTRGAWAHAAYGVGAALLTVATLVATAGLLLWAGLACLAAGMGAVIATGKKCADQTFTSNRDADLGTDNSANNLAALHPDLGDEALGSKATMLRQIAILDSESREGAAAAANIPCHDTRFKQMVRGTVMFFASFCGQEQRAERWAHRRRVAQQSPANLNWFADYVKHVSSNRFAVLDQEVAALKQKKARLKNPADAQVIDNTLKLLVQWQETEATWVETCNRDRDKPAAMASMMISWMMSRRWHEEVVSSLYLTSKDEDMRQQPWWLLSTQAEPRFDASQWLEKLGSGDAAAMRIWRTCMPVLSDFMQHRQVEVTRNRVDALTNQLRARLSPEPSV